MIKPENVKSFLPWEEIEEAAQQQIVNASQLSILSGPIAVMPDCHFGKGATVGSVVPTYKAIIPAAVGVDIGCGMEALCLNIKSSQLPSDLTKIYNGFCRDVPLGAGGRHNRLNLQIELGAAFLEDSLPESLKKEIPYITGSSSYNFFSQLGTLGSGNHFIELCIDENDMVWLMLHSGSRGIGNKIGTYYIEKAKETCAQLGLPDSDLSFLSKGETIFNDYCESVAWAQKYAAMNRRLMLGLCLNVLRRHIPGLNCDPDNATVVSCHHNYIEFVPDGTMITRKGAISARQGELGIIPGSMGTKSYIVRGKGNPDSLCSASHGAGRVMSRGQARRTFSKEDLEAQTAGVMCRKDAGVIDEIPSAYKDIDLVIERQKDLIEVVHTLKQILNVKG